MGFGEANPGDFGVGIGHAGDPVPSRPLRHTFCQSVAVLAEALTNRSDPLLKTFEHDQIRFPFGEAQVVPFAGTPGALRYPDVSADSIMSQGGCGQ